MMSNLDKIADKIQNLLKTQNIAQAIREVKIALEKFPNNYKLLLLANEVYRSSKNQEMALEHSKLAIQHHPHKPKGYALAAQDFISRKLYNQAQKVIKQGLEKFANNINLLKIATKVYLVLGKFDKSMEYAHRVHKHDGILSRESFEELLVYAASKNQAYKKQKPSNAMMATDYYFNSRFILSKDNMPFNFIYVPKNACSSIKLSLLASFTELSERNIKPHKAANKFLNEKIDWSKENYYLVRNPFKRFISAFIDKCHPRGDKVVWSLLCKRYGFNERNEISMNQLLDALIADDPNRINPHFRPQHKVLCSTLISPSKVFYMEQMDDLILFLESHSVKMIRHSPHSTKSRAASSNALEKSVINKIVQLYRSDFDLYGYSPDPINKDISHVKKDIPFVSELLTSTDAPTSVNNLRKRDSLLFEEPFLERSSSLAFILSYANKVNQRT